MAAKYNIQAHKEGGVVTVTYDLSTQMAGPELLATFQLFVMGKNLITDFSQGQQAYNGATTCLLDHPEKDAAVFFAISTNKGWTVHDQGYLRGEHDDDVSFEG